MVQRERNDSMNTIENDFEELLRNYFATDMTKLISNENDIFVFTNGIIIMSFIFTEKIEDGKMKYSLNVYKKFDDIVRLELKGKSNISKDYEHIYHTDNEDKIRKLKTLIRKFEEK